MPGDRLTYQERQRIATGLTTGLTYNEIARRLGRPRSTIVREVARNGGARGYQADRAQQATRWRARRRKPSLASTAHQSPRPPHPAGATASGQDSQARRAFEDEFADMMVETGVPAMAAKVLVCLFTTDSGSATAAELATRLRVSPASISKAVGWLERRGLIGRERSGRRERYVIDEHVWYQAWLVSVRSMALWADFAQRGADLLGDATPAGTRLHATGQFFRFLGQDMSQAAEHWRQTLSRSR
ncbi:GbsR/MarR family transcriptional regulator [Actinomadura miaoliensis]|uniref:Helix-turn-helix domain-containing protein n=1 Tax=Actinomadura miaoliensis TaxID=430685 RepID=A0ABP7WRF1_9ACTN